jgi:signal peptidase I
MLLFLTAIFASYSGFVVGVLLIVVIFSFALVDAVILAIRSKRITLGALNKWYVYALVVISSFVLVQVVFWFAKSSAYQSYNQPTISMEPTLLAGETVIADHDYYKAHALANGEVVVVSFNREPGVSYIRRCIAGEGQVVQLRNRIAFVDGKQWVAPGFNLGSQIAIQPEALSAPDVSPFGAGNADNYGPVTVPQGTVFVLADNIAASRDSRHWGFVDRSHVKGKVLYVSFPSTFARLGTVFN